MRKTFLILLLSSLSFSVFAEEIANSSAKTTASSPTAGEPKYKISETDMRILIRQLNNIEQCIFPDLAKPGYQKIYDTWTTADSITMFYFQENLLKELIGEQNVVTIENDPASEKYFNQLHEKLNHQKAHVDSHLCEEFKPTYAQMKQHIEEAIPQVYK